MAGIHFSFAEFPSLVSLNIGIAERLDENRAESMTILFCDFSDATAESIKESLQGILRSSDSIVHFDRYYFFVLPYTDKYGATVVKNMFEEFFNVYVRSVTVSYPIDGESASELFDAIRAKTQKEHNIYLECLDMTEKVAQKLQ
ncbi:MAG: hypothetical protein JXK05_14175 [Campylobacterales bacterium]|nr:hypothetical protein [Campylobacterales bacterium]